MRRFLLILIIGIPFGCFSQIEHFYGDGNGLEAVSKVPLKMGDSLYIKCKVEGHPEWFVYIMETGNYYLLCDTTGRKISEGEVGRHRTTDRFVKDGLWKEYYENGNLKAQGYYYRNDAIGLWKKYYQGGSIKALYNLSLVISNCIPDSGIYGAPRAVVKTGSYFEYYENGQVKCDGQYCSEMGMDTLSWATRIEPPYDAFPITGIVPVSKKCAVWRFYNDAGKLIEEIDYDSH